MGTNRSVLWSSRFIIIFAEMTFTSILLTILLKKGQLFPHSDALFIFIILEEFAVVTILFG